MNIGVLKKNKNGIMMGLPADMLGWLIFFLGTIIWAMIFAISQGVFTAEITGNGVYTQDKIILINLLQTKISDNTNLADEILIGIETGDKSKVLSFLDEALNGVYGRARDVCYALWYTDFGPEEVFGFKDCDEKEELFSQELFIPKADNGKMKIRLAVLGYSE